MITKIRSGQFGYSLIELLAVMAIIAVSVAITLPNLDNYRSQRDLFNAANMIREEVNKAKIAAAAPAQNTTEGYESSLVEFYVNNSDVANKPLINEYSLNLGDGKVTNKKVITLPGSVIVEDIYDEHGITIESTDPGSYRSELIFSPASGGILLYSLDQDSDPASYGTSLPSSSTYIIKLNNLDTGQEKTVEVQLATGAVHVN